MFRKEKKLLQIFTSVRYASRCNGCDRVRGPGPFVRGEQAGSTFGLGPLGGGVEGVDFWPIPWQARLGWTLGTLIRETDA